MRINWFSPLAPQRTDIAHYSARIAAALMERFEVVFWSDLEANPALLPSGARLERFDPAKSGDRAFLTALSGGVNLYNLGNDARFHAGIAQVARRIPGVVILHDTRLHHFAFEVSRRDDPPFASYLAHAEAIHGGAGLEAARRIVASEGRLIDEQVAAMPLIEPYLESSLGAICHSQAARDQLRALGDTPVLTLPLPFASLAPQSRMTRRPGPPWRLVMFGHVNTNRRLEPILRALAGWSGDFRFDIYGALWDAGLVEALVRELDLKDRVTVHGFAPEAELDAAIAGAHLAFNLRHPTMGEASGGILRAWSHGTPALVTDEGWYADLPHEVAWKVSTRTEAADVLAALDALAHEPAAFERMGQAARARVMALHSPELYVQGLAAGLDDFPTLAQRYAALGLMKRVAAQGRSHGERHALLERARCHIPGLFERAI